MRRCAEWLTVFAAFLTVAVAGPAGAAQWTFETLDGSGGGNGRVNADVGGLPSGTTATTIYAGRPHAWYPDVTNGDLRHAWWNGVEWTFETLDGAGGGNGRTSHTVGEYAAATIYAGQPHVWYNDFTAADLRHAWWNGVEWTFETLDGIAGGNGRTTDSVGAYNEVTIYAGQPHVWYHDFNTGDLRHAWWNGAQWTFETLDGAGGGNGRTTNPVGQYNAAATFAGQLHVWHLDLLGGDLRHAWWNGAQWTFETLDGAGGAGGRTSSLVGGFSAAAIYAGQLHVWYRDYGTGALRHAWWNGAQWTFETLDGNGGGGGRTTNNVGAYNAVTIYTGEPHVWYHDFTAGDLRHAWWNGAQWTFETLDGAGGGNGRTIKNVGQFNAVALYAGQPHVWYYDATVGTFRHAWWG